MKEIIGLLQREDDIEQEEKRNANTSKAKIAEDEMPKEAGKSENV